MPSPLHRAKNRVSGALAPTVTVARAIGGLTITCSNADLFASDDVALVPGDFPFYVTAIRFGESLPIFEITDATGDVLTTSGPIGGMADAALMVGDRLEMRFVAEHSNEL